MDTIPEAAAKLIASSQEHTRALYNLVSVQWPMNQIPEPIARAAAQMMASAAELEAAIETLAETTRLELRTPEQEAEEVARENLAALQAAERARSAHRPEHR